MKPTDQILITVEKVIEKFIRQKLDINETQFSLCLDMKLLTPF